MVSRVSSVTSLGGKGAYDWLVQRVSAVVLLAWVLVVGGYILLTDDLDALKWQSLFVSEWMRIFSLAAVLSLCGHAWVGLWTVATDYLTPANLGGAATFVRLLFQLACLVVLFVYFVWSVRILWSI